MKRVSEKQISATDADYSGDDEANSFGGAFEKANQEQMAKRKIVHASKRSHVDADSGAQVSGKSVKGVDISAGFADASSSIAPALANPFASLKGFASTVTPAQKPLSGQVQNVIPASTGTSSVSSTTNSHAGGKYGDKMKELNQALLTWMQLQKHTSLWNEALEDYVRHAASIAKEFKTDDSTHAKTALSASAAVPPAANKSSAPTPAPVAAPAPAPTIAPTRAPAAFPNPTPATTIRVPSAAPAPTPVWGSAPAPTPTPAVTSVGAPTSAAPTPAWGFPSLPTPATGATSAAASSSVRPPITDKPFSFGDTTKGISSSSIAPPSSGSGSASFGSFGSFGGGGFGKNILSVPTEPLPAASFELKTQGSTARTAPGTSQPNEDDGPDDDNYEEPKLGVEEVLRSADDKDEIVFELELVQLKRLDRKAELNKDGTIPWRDVGKGSFRITRDPTTRMVRMLIREKTMGKVTLNCAFFSSQKFEKKGKGIQFAAVVVDPDPEPEDKDKNITKLHTFMLKTKAEDLDKTISALNRARDSKL